MSKALWLQLPSYGGALAETDDPVAQLAGYRKNRGIARRTPERAKEERVYREQVKEWLRLPENHWCQVYLRLTGERRLATQCHHFQGRRGMLLLYREYWVPVSMEGHRYIEDNKPWARESGMLCPMGYYNSPVTRPIAA